MEDDSIIGRPRDVADRVAAYAAALSEAGLSSSFPNLQAAAFWDGTLVPTHGLAAPTTDVVLRGDLPWSASVDVAAKRLADDGRLGRSTAVDPEASEALRPSRELLTLGDAALACRWGTRLRSLLQGLVAGEDRVASWTDTSDVSTALASDPDLALLRRTGSSAATMDMGEAHPGLAGRRGNAAEAATRAWTLSGGGGTGVEAADMDMAALAYGMLLARLAASASPTFGGRRDRDLAGRVVVGEGSGERDGHAVVRASFGMDGDSVATATYEVRTRVVEEFRSGATRRVAAPDGTLLEVFVEPAWRRKGIGSLVVRHAAASGCVRSACPTAEGKALLARHGHARDDGGYDLCEPRGPTPAGTSDSRARSRDATGEHKP